MGVPNMEVAAGEALSVPVSVTNATDFNQYGQSISGALYYEDNPVPIAYTDIASEQAFLAGENRTFSFDTQLSPHLPAGMYYARVFAGQSTAKQARAQALGGFNALAEYPVFVVASDAEAISFDFSSVTVNDESLPAGTIYEFSNDTTGLEVAFSVINSHEQKPEKGTLRYQLYEGLRPHEAKLIEERSESVKLVSGGARVSTFNIVPLQYSEYVLVVTLEIENGGTEVLTVPMQAEGRDMEETLPLGEFLNVAIKQSGETTELAACFGSLWHTLQDYPTLVPQEINLEATVYTLNADGNAATGRVLGKEERSGEIIDLGLTTYGLLVPVNASASGYAVSLSLTQNGEVVDTKEILFPCASGDCGPAEGSGSSALDVRQALLYVIYAFVVVIGLLILANLYFFLARRGKRLSAPAVSTPTPSAPVPKKGTKKDNNNA